MKFDTLLKLGTHAAQLFQHDSFQQMSKMIQNGVKRRAADPHHWMNGSQLPYSHDRFHPHVRGHFAPLPPYHGRGTATGTGQAGGNGTNPLGDVQLKHLLTPDNLNAVRQLLNGINKAGNNNN